MIKIIINTGTTQFDDICIGDWFSFVWDNETVIGIKVRNSSDVINTLIVNKKRLMTLTAESPCTLIDDDSINIFIK